MARRHLVLVSALIHVGGAVAGCAVIPDEDNVAHSWAFAQIYLPAKPDSFAERAQSSRDATMKVPRGTTLPVVLYLHGSGGIGRADVRNAYTLAGAGYAVILPDSFARPGRISNCGHPAAPCLSFPQAYDWRLAEIRYAVARLRELPWVDGRNIFLMGFSEGGGATALYGGNEFAGHIITGWTCHSGDRRQEGIAAPISTPVLSVVANDDPWFRRATSQGHCGTFMASRRDAKSIVIQTQRHDINAYPEAMEEIFAFLKRYRR